MKRCVVCNEEFDIPGIRCRTCRAAAVAVKPKPVVEEKAEEKTLSEEQKMGIRAVHNASVALAQHQFRQRMFRRMATRRGA